MQASFSDLEYASKRKQTRRDRFLAQLDTPTAWAALVAAIAPLKGKSSGRPHGVLKEPKTQSIRLKRAHLPDPYPKTGPFFPQGRSRVGDVMPTAPVSID